MKSIRSSVDIGRLAAAARRPGIDPRVNIVRAVVTDVVFDPDHGLFADVRWQPDGEIETCLVAADYAGDGFGEYWPLAVDDLVLVAVPMGDPGEGPTIFRRLWTGSEKPPIELSENDLGGEEPTKDPTLRLEDGTTMRIVGKLGAGYKIELDGGSTFEIAATNGSKVIIAADTTVQITGTASVTIDSNAKVDITGTSSVTLDSNVSIKLGASAALGNARLNDPVLATSTGVAPALGLVPWAAAVVTAFGVVPAPTILPPLDPVIGNISGASTKVTSE